MIRSTIAAALLCSASATAVIAQSDRVLWARRAEQLCCLTEGPHWRLVDKRRCYTDRWRAKSELRWCLQGDRRTKPTRAELVRQLELEHFPPTPEAPPAQTPTPTEDPWHNVPPPPAVGPTSTLRALDKVRTVTTLRTQRAADPPDPDPDLRGTSTPPGAPRFTQPPLVPSGQPPTPPVQPTPTTPQAPAWPWLALALALLMLGTAATEDID
jgi:hypothetical protein